MFYYVVSRWDFFYWTCFGHSGLPEFLSWCHVSDLESFLPLTLQTSFLYPHLTFLLMTLIYLYVRIFHCICSISHILFCIFHPSHFLCFNPVFIWSILKSINSLLSCIQSAIMPIKFLMLVFILFKSEISSSLFYMVFNSLLKLSILYFTSQKTVSIVDFKTSAWLL